MYVFYCFALIYLLLLELLFRKRGVCVRAWFLLLFRLVFKNATRQVYSRETDLCLALP